MRSSIKIDKIYAQQKIVGLFRYLQLTAQTQRAKKATAQQ
jgi:hypothetical protein